MPIETTEKYDSIEHGYYAKGERDGASCSGCASGDPAYRAGWNVGRQKHKGVSQTTKSPSAGRQSER